MLPGLPLLLAGDFAPVPVLLIAAPLFTALTVNVLHRVPGSWPVDLAGREPERPWTAWFALAGTLAVAGGFAAWQLLRNSPSVIDTRGPGASFQAGFWIAQHGSLPIPGSLAAFGGSHPGLHLSGVGFFALGHSVVPAVMAGLPMLLAGGFWTAGTGGGAVIAPVIGGLAVLSFGGLAGRLAGRRWAPAGAFALALTLPEIYTSRDAFGEPAVQVLIFGGLSLVVDALTVGRRGQASMLRTASAWTPEGATDENASGAQSAARDAGPRRNRFGSPLGAWSLGAAARLRGLTWRGVLARLRGTPTPELVLAFTAGLSLGLTSLFSLASLVYLVPAVAVAGVLIVTRRAPGVAFCIGGITGCGYGLAAAFLLARPTVHFLAPTLRVIGEDAGGVFLLTAAALLLRFQPRWLRLTGNALARRPLRWLPDLAAFVLLAAVAVLAVRPYLQTVRGSLGPAGVHYVAALQRVAGLKVDPTRLYSEDTLYWVTWYAGIPTLLLGAFGAAILLRRCLRSLLTWRDDSGAAAAWALPLAIVIGGSAAVLWQPFTVPDQPWASRRLVPVVIPGLILAGIWAAAWLSRRARDRGAGRTTAAVVGAFCVAAMVLPSVTTAFGFGLSHSGPGGGLRATADGLAQHSVGTGQNAAVHDLCAAIGRSSSVLILDQRAGQVFGQVIRGMCGVPAAWMPRHAPASQVDAVIGGILRVGRRPVVLGVKPAQIGSFGGSPTQVVNLSTTQNAHDLTQPAGAPWPARYVLWMVVGSSQNIGI